MVAGGSAQFTLGLDNNTDYKVKEAWYPLIGGLQKLGPDASAWVPTSTPWEKPLQAPFGTNQFGYPGADEHVLRVRAEQVRGQGDLLRLQDEIARYKVYHLMGIAGKDKGEDVFACIQHLPFTAARQELQRLAGGAAGSSTATGARRDRSTASGS